MERFSFLLRCACVPGEHVIVPGPPVGSPLFCCDAAFSAVISRNHFLGRQGGLGATRKILFSFFFRVKKKCEGPQFIFVQIFKFKMNLFEFI